MTQSTVLRLRGWWLSIHKWIGILLAVLIIPLSVTGAALVWDGALDRALNPGRYEVTGTPALPASAYAEAARAALRPGESLLSLRFEEEGPVVATAARAADGEGARGAPRAREGARREGRRGGPPVRTNVWIDPGSARVLDVASSNSGLVRMLHRLHGSFMIPGVGRQIVGWVGVAMLLSCLTGIWLWWPVGGNVQRGFRWKRRDSFSANLHHQLGFWILLPLAMLSFTGAWISFPQFFGRFEAASAQRAGGPPDRARAMSARPLPAPRLPVDEVVRAARPLGEGALASIAWPTDREAVWKIGFRAEGGPAREVRIDDASGAVTPPAPPPETVARKMRRWHDGTGMGPLWQTVIFLGGVIPAVLSVTGIVMWLRTRRWRARIERKRKAARRGPATQAAE